MCPELHRQTSLPAKSFTTKSCVCPLGKRSSSILLVLFLMFSVKRSLLASLLGTVTSNLVTIGALLSALLCSFAVAIGLSSWEKEGAAANATDAAQSRGRTRRLSKAVTAIHEGQAGDSHISEKPNLSTLRRTVNDQVTD